MTKRINISMEFSQIKALEELGVSNLSAYLRRLIKKDLEVIEKFKRQLEEKGFSDSDIERYIERLVNWFYLSFFLYFFSFSLKKIEKTFFSFIKIFKKLDFFCV